MKHEEPMCRVTFLGNDRTKEHWFEAISTRSITEATARTLQLREGYDPETHGFLHFQSHKRGKQFVARWVCCSEIRRSE
jgi:hypothetical protein